MKYLNFIDNLLYQIYEKIIQAKTKEELDKAIKTAESYLLAGYIPSPKDSVLKDIIRKAKERMSPIEKEYTLSQILPAIENAKIKWRDLPENSPYKKEGFGITVATLNMSITDDFKLPYPTLALFYRNNNFKFIYQTTQSLYNISHFAMCDTVTDEPIASDDIINYIGTITNLNGIKVYVIPATFLLAPKIYGHGYINFLTKEINDFLTNNPDFIRSIFNSAEKLESTLLIRKPLKKI